MRQIRGLQNASGFTLIQVSIILVVASLTMVAVLPGYQLTSKSGSVGVNKMNAIMSALRQFQVANGRLPCPADASYAAGNTNYGKEAANPQTNCTAGTPAANFVDATNKVAIGMLPVQALQLPSDYALDGYGRKITYAVDTNTTGCWAAQSLNGKIVVADNGINYNSVVAMVSHGANGHGAWLTLPGTGTGASRLDAGSTDTDQLLNAHITNGTFPTATASSLVTSAAGTTVTFVKKTPTSTFDDTVVYRDQFWSQNAVPSALLTATSVSTYPANGTYGAGQVFTFILTFPQAVTVTGNPRLILSALDPANNNIGTSNVAYATYQSGSGTATLTFQYTVQVTDIAASGIKLASQVDMNSGFVNPCFTFFSAPDLSGVKIGTYVYVDDQTNNNIQKFDTAGNYIMTFASGVANQSGLALDASGNVFVANSNKVNKYNSSGVLQTAWGPNANGTIGTIDGTDGSGNGEFHTAFGLAINKTTGDIYVGDDGNCRIQRFNSAGIYQSQWGTCGTGNGQFDDSNGPAAIAIDSVGNLWVTDVGNCRIQEFNSSGTYLRQVGGSGCNGTNGHFGWWSVWGVAVDSSDNVYGTDCVNNRIEKFNSSGVYQNQFGSVGSGDGQFSCPDVISIDSGNNIWVTDDNNYRVDVFDSSYNFVRKFGTHGSGAGQFNGVNYITTR